MSIDALVLTVERPELGLADEIEEIGPLQIAAARAVTAEDWRLLKRSADPAIGWVTEVNCGNRSYDELEIFALGVAERCGGGLFWCDLAGTVVEVAPSRSRSRTRAPLRRAIELEVSSEDDDEFLDGRHLPTDPKELEIRVRTGQALERRAAFSDLFAIEPERALGIFDEMIRAVPAKNRKRRDELGALLLDLRSKAAQLRFLDGGFRAPANYMPSEEMFEVLPQRVAAAAGAKEVESLFSQVRVHELSDLFGAPLPILAALVRHSDARVRVLAAPLIPPDPTKNPMLQDLPRERLALPKEELPDWLEIAEALLDTNDQEVEAAALALLCQVAFAQADGAVRSRVLDRARKLAASPVASQQQQGAELLASCGIDGLKEAKQLNAKLDAGQVLERVLRRGVAKAEALAALAPFLADASDRSTVIGALLKVHSQRAFALDSGWIDALAPWVDETEVFGALIALRELATDDQVVEWSSRDDRFDFLRPGLDPRRANGLLDIFEQSSVALLRQQVVDAVGDCGTATTLPRLAALTRAYPQYQTELAAAALSIRKRT